MKKIITLILFSLTLFYSFNSFSNESNGVTDVYLLKINEIITSSTAEVVSDCIKSASHKNSYLLIEINTPGGILESARKIVQSIMASPVPVIVHVYPAGARAGSAGIFIALAADFAVMEEGSNIGAAHPVSVTGKDIEGDLGEKIENDTLAFIRSVAEKRGRNIEAAEKMVSESISYTSAEALKMKIIDAVSNKNNNINELIKDRFNINGEINIIPLTPTFIQSVFRFIANPDIMAALLFIGVLMIIFEFKVPGTFVFAGIGALCLILFAFGANIIPINYLAVFLILCGIGLLIAEIFVASLGLLTVGGIACMLFGMRMLFDREGNIDIGISPLIIAFIIAVAALCALIIGRLIAKDFKRRPASGISAMIGKEAVILDWNEKKGHVSIYGEIWNAESAEQFKEGETGIISNYNNMVFEIRKK